MAFSIPIVRKDYDIYNSNKNRQRRLSDCSNSKSQSTARHKSQTIAGSAHPVSKSVGHSCSATPIGSSHVSTPIRRYSTSKPPSSSSSSSATASKYDNLQKSKSLHTVDHHPHPSTSAGHASTNSLAKFHTKLVDRLKNSITCSSNKKTPARAPGSSKSTGQLESKRS
ncbi:vitellogenin-2 [Diaphorina citri]|uniref:Vitellogenin-2 n=1 Tax=Diaphorina citri TaxID=121845 RepID=A0A1S3CVS5_DIACI|nr:vitellogenin-2 [Diaphorina citri]KAI5717773.1 hypothetical protein M8J77_011085 [Diaphorina citri]